MRKLLVSFAMIVLVALCIVVSGCTSGSIDVAFKLPQPGSTSTSSVATQSYVQFTSTKSYCLDVEKDVSKKLTTFLDAGDHNVTEVDLSYTQDCLASAIVYYIPDTTGEGNQLRVKLITRSKDDFSYTDVQNDINQQIDSVSNSGLRVYHVDKVKDGDFIVRAAIWYKA